MNTKTLLLTAALGLASASVQANLLFSQYIETDSGTTPKGIEIWNSGATDIDFSVKGLIVEKGVNGGAPASDFTLSTGILAAGDVWVIGTSDIGTYLETTFGVGVVNYSDKSFTFNGDDALVLKLDGSITDVFGTPGSDPGSAWSGSGVSSANQNIKLLEGASLITSGTNTGFTDPSTRFTTVSSNPSGTGGLDGFGIAPIPEPSVAAFLLIGMGFLFRFMRKKK